MACPSTEFRKGLVIEISRTLCSWSSKEKAGRLSHRSSEMVRCTIVSKDKLKKCMGLPAHSSRSCLGLKAMLTNRCVLMDVLEELKRAGTRGRYAMAGVGSSRARLGMVSKLRM